MKQRFSRRMTRKLSFALTVVALVAVSLVQLSFKTTALIEEFWKQLGISQIQADKKISNSFLEGYPDYYGIRNFKNMAMSNRAGIAKDVCAYTKEFVQSEKFLKDYAALRESRKPAPPQKSQTPEELRASMITSAKKTIEDTEVSLKKANDQMKPIFENVLRIAKQQLKDAEDPKNKMIDAYTKNYPAMVKNMEEGHQRNIKNWETEYPVDPSKLIKVRLQDFLSATEGVDYSAELIEKNGKKYFVKAEYERKDNRWKMAYRAGKEPVEAARAFAQQWLKEIK